MQSLEKLLAALPAEERRDALDYYDEYFDAAGPDREAETLAELGSPEEVAQKILEDQPTVPAVSDPNGASRPPQAAAHRLSLNQTLRWAGLAVVVVILCMFMFQHSFARQVAQTGDVYTIASSDSAQTASATEVSLEALKKLTLDLDTGSVIFEEKAGLTGSFTARQVDAKMLTADNSMGSLSIGLLRAEKADLSTDMGSVTVTLPAPAENYALHASSDMGKLTIAGKTYQESYTSSGHYPVTLSTNMGQITVNYK